MKKCNKCKIEKPLDEFNSDASKTDGKHGNCKECKKKWVVENIDKVKEHRKKWVVKNTDKIKEYKKKWAVENTDKIKEYSAKKDKEYPEKIKAKNVAHKIKVPEGYQRHHWSYNEPDRMDIIALTREQHSILHTKMSYDKEKMMFINKESGMVMIKQDHIELIAEMC